jgi:hypothetical protein
LPLEDEPHLEAWRSYAGDAQRDGAWNALRPRFAQLQFGIREGLSDDETYRRATRRGEFPDEAVPGLDLRDPDGLTLEIHPSLAGTVPILTAGNRDDFVALVRAFTARGEPAPVPDSMGACMVSGFNNWDRISRYRERWEAADPAHLAPGAWGAEFKRIIPNKELYQDRFVILSRGAYSNVAAVEMGMAQAAWIEASYRIRREHECTHYFSLRVFSRLQHNVLEEIIADLVGTIHGFGEYRPEAMLRFLGLDRFPEFRPGGRLEVYRGDPPVSDAAFSVLSSLAHRAILNLREVCAATAVVRGEPAALAALVFAMTPMTLEELAAEDGAERIRQEFGTAVERT